MRTLQNWFLVMAALFGGCSNQNVDIKYNETPVPIQEEEKTKTSLEREALIAGDCPEIMAEWYEKELNKFASDLAIQAAVAQSDLGRARLLAAEINKTTDFHLFEYRLHYLSNPGIRFTNCTLSSILFNNACRKLGIKSGFMLNLTHMFNYVEVNGKRVYVDSTTENSEPCEEDLNQEELHEASYEEVISSVYGIKGAVLEAEGKVIQAEKTYKTGLSVYPRNQSILENLVKMHLNFGEYQQALENLDLYMQAYPDSEQLKKHRKDLLERLGGN